MQSLEDDRFSLSGRLSFPRTAPALVSAPHHPSAPPLDRLDEPLAGLPVRPHRADCLAVYLLSLAAHDRDPVSSEAHVFRGQEGGFVPDERSYPFRVQHPDVSGIGSLG